MHRYLLHNDDIRDTGAQDLSAGQVGLLNGWGVFSTIRVYDGVMFAWERHWDRMRIDAGRMRVPFPPDRDWLAQRLQRLIDANRALNATLARRGDPQPRRHVRRSRPDARVRCGGLYRRCEPLGR